MLQIIETIDKCKIILDKLLADTLIIKYRINVTVNIIVDIYIHTENEIDIAPLIQLSRGVKVSIINEIEPYSYEESIFNFQHQDNVILNNSRQRFRDLLNPLKEQEFSLPCPVITFYSYKGGMGRSTTLASCASYLSMHYGYRVVIMDCDFEAPGFTNYFLENPEQPLYNKGIVEYLMDKKFLNERPDLTQYTIEVSNEYTKRANEQQTTGAIYIMPAGNVDDDNLRNTYLEGLARIDISSGDYIAKQFHELINDIHQALKPDVILIDSRTGFNDIFGLTALRLSTSVVGFFGNNIQNQPGLHYFLDMLNELSAKRPFFTGICVNSILPQNSWRELFSLFEQSVNEYMALISNEDVDAPLNIGSMDGIKVNENDIVKSLSVLCFPIQRNDILELVGTTKEDKSYFIDLISEKQFIAYRNLFDKIQSVCTSTEVFTNKLVEQSALNLKAPKQEVESRLDIVSLKKVVLSKLLENWPLSHADNPDLIIDFQKEKEQNRYFYRSCMDDLFNHSKFLFLGNKGTGKSYIYQSLKEETIVNELKKRAGRVDNTYVIVHAVERTSGNFLDVSAMFNGSEYQNAESFYRNFWLVYFWSVLIKELPKQNIPFTSKLPALSLNTIDLNKTKTDILDFVGSLEKLIIVEQDLKEIDSLLKRNNKFLLILFDQLDEIVKPSKNNWAERIAPLINFLKVTRYGNILPKVFLRRDLFKKLTGITNSKDLENSSTSLEWKHEELLSYFFKLLLSNSKEEFIQLIHNYDGYDKDHLRIIEKALKKTENYNQLPLEKGYLYPFVECFFGKYADSQNTNRFGESYDWLYKNLKNADDTINIRPFIDLLESAIKKAKEEDVKEWPILGQYFYNNRFARTIAVQRHFDELVNENGNEDIRLFFDFIYNNQKYQFISFHRTQLLQLLEDFYNQVPNVEHKYAEDLINLLVINGIIRESNYGRGKIYEVALLYKYRWGLRDRKRIN